MNIQTKDLSLFLLSALIFLVIYWQTIFYGYIADDYILINKSYTDALDATLHTIHFRPIWHLSYPFVNDIFGKTSFAHHLVNISLHFTNITLAFLVFSKWIGVMRSFIAITIWTILPWSVFPIVWISQRNDLLMTFFILSAILAADNDKNTASKWLIILAFLSKVTCLFFSFIYLSKRIYNKGNKDYILGVIILLSTLIISWFSLKNGVEADHIKELSPLLKITNHLKNWLVNWITIFIPIPFFFSKKHAILYLAFLMMFCAFLYFRFEINKAAYKPTVIAFLLSLPTAFNSELRIVYLESLFLLVAIVSCIRFNFPTEKNVTKIFFILMMGCWFFYVIPATIATKKKFISNEYTGLLSNRNTHQENATAYQNSFYYSMNYYLIYLKKQLSH